MLGAVFIAGRRGRAQVQPLSLPNGKWLRCRRNSKVDCHRGLELADELFEVVLHDAGQVDQVAVDVVNHLAVCRRA